MDFCNKIDIEVNTPKSKNEFAVVNIAPHVPHFGPPPKPLILGEEVLKIHVNVKNNPITALNVCESSKCPLLTRNRGQGTGW